MRLTDVYDEFVKYATLERCLEDTTINWYERTLKPFFKYLRYNMLEATTESLTVETLRNFFISHRRNGNSPRTILNNMQGIKSFCTFLVKRGYLPNNPFAELEKPKLAHRLPEFLDENESKELLQTCLNRKSIYRSKWHRDVAIIAIFLFTGIRKRELLNLKLSDVNIERSYIKVYAKSKERLVPLNETVKEFLLRYLKVRPKREAMNHVFLSTNRSRSPLTSEGLNCLFGELKNRMGFKKQLLAQILRHTFCTLMLRNGVNLRDIQLIAGHSDISTTARFYLGCDDKQLKQAVNRHPLNI